jgi:hypothetical protein
MCPHTLKGVTQQHMDADLAIDMVRQEVELGCTTILTHHLGEPTLHPEYERIVRTVRANHPSVTLKLFTNGWRLGDHAIRAVMAECADYIVVSIDGVRMETAQSTRPGLKMRDVFDGFKKLAAMPRRGGLVTQGVIIPEVNEHEERAYSRAWRLRGADEGHPYRDVRARPAVFPNPCSRIYTQIDVRVDGTLGICCRDPENLYPLGNAFTEGIEALWYGDKAREFRRQHRAGNIPLCNECTWEGVYDGDPGALE